MKPYLFLPLVFSLLITIGNGLCDENKQTSKRAPLFSSVDDALSVLSNQGSKLQWEASYFLKDQPEAIPKLKNMVEKKHPSWFIALCTLTELGGKDIAQFLCDLLDKNRHEMDATGKRKIYGFGSPLGCEKPHYLYGKALTSSIGKLGEKSADSSLVNISKDADEAVLESIPKARYDIGALSLEDLVKTGKTDPSHGKYYFGAVLAIGGELIHKNTDEAIQIFENLCDMDESEDRLRNSAHVSLVQCYELKKNYQQALKHCNWVIENADETIAGRYRNQRPILMFHRGDLTVDELFTQAAKNPELFDRIAQLGRSYRFDTLNLFNRIIKEVPPGSRHHMEAEYWKLEYYDRFNQPELARQQAEYLLEKCEHTHIIGWVERRQGKNKELNERAGRKGKVNR